MKSVKGIVSLTIAVLFSLGVTLTAFASDVTKSITDAAEAVVGSATDSAVETTKEKAGEAIANAMGDEKKEEVAAEEKKEEAGDEATKEEAAPTAEGEVAEEAPEKAPAVDKK
jgi:hypothetical protein